MVSTEAHLRELGQIAEDVMWEELKLVVPQVEFLIQKLVDVLPLIDNKPFVKINDLEERISYSSGFCV